MLTYLRKRRTFCIFLLGFSSGLPLLLTLSTLQAWYTEAKVDIKTIGMISLVSLPYVWKFLWAPIIDRFVLPIFGRRRGWVALMQLLLAMALCLVAQLNPEIMPKTVALVAIFIAFFSATQDIGINAYQTEILTPEERGVGASFQISGYRIAMLISGGIALMLAGQFGWRVTYMIMAALMLLSIVSTWYAPEPRETIQQVNTLKTAVIEPFREFITRKNAIIILCFLLLYKIGDDFAQALLSTFFLRHLGLSLTLVGSVYKVVGFLGTVIGALIGGYYVLKKGLYYSLMLFGIFQMASTLFFLALAIVGKHYALFVLSIVAETVSAGMGTSAFMAFVMSLCNHRYTATQYALFSAFFSIGRIVVGPIAGEMISSWGWENYFVWSFLMGLPGLLCLWYMRQRIDFNAIELR